MFLEHFFLTNVIRAVGVLPVLISLNIPTASNFSKNNTSSF